MPDLLIVSAEPLTSGNKKVLAHAMGQAGLNLEDADLLSLCAMYVTALVRQQRDGVEMFLSQSQARVIVTLGPEALLNICGLRPLIPWRGCLVAPEECTDPILGKRTHFRLVLPTSTEWIVPSISPRSAVKSGTLEYLEFDMARAARALRNELQVVQAG